MSGRFVTFHTFINACCVAEGSIEVRATFVSCALSADTVTVPEVTSGTLQITLLPIPTRFAFLKNENRAEKITYKPTIFISVFSW